MPSLTYNGDDSDPNNTGQPDNNDGPDTYHGGQPAFDLITPIQNLRDANIIRDLTWKLSDIINYGKPVDLRDPTDWDDQGSKIGWWGLNVVTPLQNLVKPKPKPWSDDDTETGEIAIAIGLFIVGIIVIMKYA